MTSPARRRPSAHTVEVLLFPNTERARAPIIITPAPTRLDVSTQLPATGGNYLPASLTKHDLDVALHSPDRQAAPGMARGHRQERAGSQMVGEGRQEPREEAEEEWDGGRAGESHHHPGCAHQVHHHRSLAGWETAGQRERGRKVLVKKSG